jgi:hypothetical protein
MPRAARLVDVSLCDVVRAVTHVVRWLDYQAASGTEHLGSAARLSFYSSGGSSAEESEAA